METPFIGDGIIQIDVREASRCLYDDGSMEGSNLQRSGACPICRTNAGPVALREGEYSGRQCVCGVIYIDPLPAHPVDASIDHHHSVYYSAPARARVGWVKAFTQRGRLLEIGCGDGEFTAAAIRAGFTVEAVEPSDERATRLERTLGITVERALIEDSRLPEGRYDTSFHVDLLSHFPDPVAALRAIAAKVAPGGTVCFEVGLFSNLSPFWQRLVGRPNMPTHMWFFDAPAIERLLDAAGLKMIAMRRYPVGLSTALSTVLGSRRVAAAPDSHAPLAQGWAAAPYYRLHMFLRYGIGRWLPMGGPQTAFVAARHKTDSA
ncbi:MAG: methyltransferase domain-containing protein [Mesorhizobium sp.]|nr:class I SAM-dependent methyltransferase [Mesorhizobium sp. M6A.T.Cr.TU.016.01.1.1]RUU27777.1 methyltransferase domain-containing protein [Mesorhizobium sp. M6A.T.Ce.TU.016.01.1.1]RWN67901.1 MAG: methyltransferase domain-containing protein [Mesorhizobium sp.]RWP44513.1 MAG: methyltransferase domain-containing protein [Mesorhizobium sp.]RWP48232.1 MAG: methyltransferase domain-containing protein [Mesorhizobium sp.]